MPIDSLVRILGIVFGFGMPLLATGTAYRRDMALIEKGLYQAERPKSPNTPCRGFLITGSIVAAMGMALVDRRLLSTWGERQGCQRLSFCLSALHCY